LPAVARSCGLQFTGIEPVHCLGLTICHGSTINIPVSFLFAFPFNVRPQILLNALVLTRSDLSPLMISRPKKDSPTGILSRKTTAIGKSVFNAWSTCA